MISTKSARTRALATLFASAAAGASLLAPLAASAAPAAAGKTSAVTTTSATAATQAATATPFLKSGQRLKPGQYIRSANNVYTFLMQTDGNAVLYKGRTAVWSTATNRKSSALVMQKDGNMVVYSGRTAVWASGTAGSTGAFLAVQNDSNLVIYNIRKKPVWTRAMVLVTLGVNRVLRPGQILLSHNRIFRLQMQTDGNLVMLKNAKTVLWHTATGRNPGAYVAMQGDGNLVVYSANKRALWHSGTNRGPSVLQMQNDGNAVIRYGRTAVWSTGTGGR